ncbi:hypothetical protein [Mesorhizobium sp.]|nr:hypothetical protein [Mesorhizobium sp.]
MDQALSTSAQDRNPADLAGVGSAIFAPHPETTLAEQERKTAWRLLGR